MCVCVCVCVCVEGSVLFNDALNTFYLRLLVYGVRHMVKDHSNSEKGNLLPPHGLSFRLHQSWNTGWNDKCDIYISGVARCQKGVGGGGGHTDT